MITETTYGPNDLEKGKCTSCNMMSNEIVIGEDMCVDCIEEQRFFDETMKGL